MLSSPLPPGLKTRVDTHHRLSTAVKAVGASQPLSVVPDEAALASAVRQAVAQSGRSSARCVRIPGGSSDHLRCVAHVHTPHTHAVLNLRSFAELHRRLAAQPGLRASTRWGTLLLLLRTSPSTPQAGALTGASHGGLPTMDVALPPASGLRAQAYTQFAECEVSDFDVSEADLVRDVLFVCQGIDGRHIRFEATVDGYLLDRHVSIPPAPRQLLQRLCEAGWLARRLRSYLARPPGGAVARALAAAVAQEVAQYDQLLAVLEAQAQGEAPTPGAVSATSAPYLTLRRLDVWLADPMAALRRLAVLTDATAGLQGCHLVAALHTHVATGDAAASALVTRLLKAACVPLCAALVGWTTRGELGPNPGEDEFFVVEDSGVGEEHLWRRKYSLTSGPLPPVVDARQAGEALRIGKSLNFLRRCCGATSWAADAPAVLAAVSDAGGLVYGNPGSVEALLRTAARAVDERLCGVMFTQFRLGEHCAAIKRYLLLGQGDFITSLIDGVGTALWEAAAGVSAYRLASVLEAAVRASNAQFDDPDVLGRLRVKLLPHGGGETGWDVFCLEYVVNPPLTTVLTDDAMHRYLRVFTFLWRLKRVEAALSGTWGGMKPNAPGGGAWTALVAGTSKRGGQQPDAAGASGDAHLVVPLLRRCHTLRAEMAHFVTNLQYYIMFEVLEHSWLEFTAAMGSAADLDGLIAAHEAYLDAIVAKALLGDRSALVAQQLGSLFDLMLRFAGLADRLFDVAREAASQAGLDGRQRGSRGSGGMTSRDPEEDGGGGGTPAGRPPAGPLPPLAEMGAQLDALAGTYAQLLEGFLNLLPVQKHVDLRALLFRLDFSTYYSGTLATQFVTPARGLGPVDV